ncbi:MAG: sugar phosphate isomerase/epimerase [Clostridia bacterium]|nr:sugar phosphate isomerase/epimerase [Clostridia bacterium]
MRLATTTEDFSRFCKTNTERLECIAKAGFKYVDLSQYVEKDGLEIYGCDNWRDNVKKLGEHAKRLGLTFVQSHSPGLNPFEEDRYDHVVDIVKRSIEVCGILGIKNTVLHNGYIRDASFTKEAFLEKNVKFFSEFYPLLEEYGVNLLCENTTKKNMPNWYFPTTGKEMVEFVKEANHPLVHICWDTGHCNCEGNQYEHIMDMGKELYALHINDNTGRGDEHLMPYCGTLNMDDVMHGLIDSGYKGYFTFESCSTLRPAKYWQGNRHEFAKDTRTLEPQLFMQMHMEKLLYEVGEYVLKQYGVFEE